MAESHGIELVPIQVYEPGPIFVICKLSNPKLLILIEIVGWQLTQHVLKSPIRRRYVN